VRRLNALENPQPPRHNTHPFGRSWPTAAPPTGPDRSPSGAQGGRQLRSLVIVALIGIISGLLQALLGIGGGVIVVPALVFVAAFSQKEAQAASLWYVVPTSLFAGILYSQSGELEIRIAFVAAMVAAAFVGVVIGVSLVKRIHQRRLQQVFGVSVVLISAIMIWRSCTGNIVAIQDDPNKQYLVLTWTGFAAGFLSSLLGIGGGVLVVPILVLIGAFEQKVAQGMSLLYIVPTALFSATLYKFHAKITVDLRKVALMMGAGLIGAYGGWRLVRVTPAPMLRVIFASALGVLGVFIFLRARRARLAEHVPDWII